MSLEERRHLNSFAFRVWSLEFLLANAKHETRDPKPRSYRKARPLIVDGREQSVLARLPAATRTAQRFLSKCFRLMYLNSQNLC